MRRRILSPELWNDGKVLKLHSDLGKLLWIGLIALTDDEGIVELDPDVLKSKLALQAHADEIEALLGTIIEKGMIVPYQVDGQRFAFLPQFYRHQRLDRPSPTDHPRPPDAILFQHTSYVAKRNECFANSRSRHRDEFGTCPNPVQDMSRTSPAETNRTEAKRSEKNTHSSSKTPCTPIRVYDRPGDMTKSEDA